MLVLHTYFRSTAAYRVRIALELKGLTYQPVPVHLVRNGGEQHSEAFAALNPAELVPVLVDGPRTLTQSLPIIEYLDELHAAPPLLPADAAGRARVRAIAQTIACEMHPLNNLRVLQRLEDMGVDAPARSAWYTHWVSLGFKAVEALLRDSASTGMYCHGDTPGLADCCLVPQIYNAHRFKIALDAYPLVQRIGANCLQLPAFQRAAPEAQADAA
ncbi:maleylacetoacetate isomerase [Rhodoferax sp.]|uniref:maleylacetoacetate isomerase n=1 Tax=Rhodoferax sp. TaxID=50421 RepID=UPI00374D6AC3